MPAGCKDPYRNKCPDSRGHTPRNRLRLIRPKGKVLNVLLLFSWPDLLISMAMLYLSITANIFGTGA